jgi:hypothetical protein
MPGGVGERRCEPPSTQLEINNNKVILGAELRNIKFENYYTGNQ